MPEEGLAGDTTKTEARRVHLALRTSGATRRAGSALVNLSTSAPGQPELTRSICENGPCAVPRDVPSSLGHQLVPYTGTDMVQECVLSQLLFLIPKCPDRCDSKFRHQKWSSERGPRFILLLPFCLLEN